MPLGSLGLEMNFVNEIYTWKLRNANENTGYTVSSKFASGANEQGS
jgi:hypothetical protein